MTLQGCPGGSGFCDFESMNAQKTFVCALYGHDKRLPKMVPGSQGAAPGAANVWWLSTALTNVFQAFTDLNTKSMGIFPDAQGQITLQSTVRSSQILNSSNTLLLSSLPAKIEKI